LVGSVAPDEMSRYLAAADVAVSFIRPCYSKQASSPTKNAEYLAAGLPLIANSGVGDVDEMIRKRGVGVLIQGFDEAEYRRAISIARTFPDIAARCRAAAHEEFDLKALGGPRYRALYERLSSKK
jgi:glycosyltransferase involved in cell wall biosynthesis